MACTDRITLGASLAAEPSAPGQDQGPGHGDTLTSLHLLPCCIEHNGPANVSAFFSPQVENADAKPPVLVSAFRGRRLRGASLELPLGYRGVVLREQEGEAADLGTATRAAEAEAEAEAGRGDEDQAKEEGTQEGNGGGGGAGEKAGCAARWVEEGHFRSFTYWQHDTGPRESDGPNKAMQWLSLAGEIHKPVTEEDMKRAAESSVS